MKYFVYAKIGNYLYLQRNLPDFLNCRLNFVSFLSTLKKDLQKSCAEFNLQMQQNSD